MIMKYKIGDKVVLRDDLIVGNFYGSCSFAREMRDSMGQVVEIIGIDVDDDFRIDESGYYYSVEMIDEEATIELIDHEKRSKLNDKSEGEHKMWILNENGEEKETTIEDILNSKTRIVIHCNTEEKAREYFTILRENGIRWCTGEAVDESKCHYHYAVYGSNTCYEIDIEDKDLSFSDIDYFLSNLIGYEGQICKYIKRLTPKKNLKVWELECGKRYKQLQIPIEHAVFEMDEDGDLIRISSHGIRESELELNFLKSILQYEFEEIEYVFPQKGDFYYSIQIDHDGIDTLHHKWQNDAYDKEMLKYSNTFKTKKEAEAKIEEIKQILKNK